MKAYQEVGRALEKYLQPVAGSREERAALWKGRKTVYMPADLHAYGVSDWTIGAMVELGFLEEIDVTKKDAPPIRLSHKYRLDTEYREKMKEVRTGVWERRVASYATRRDRLLKNVIIPFFGTDGKAPDEVTVTKVVEQVTGPLREQYGRDVRAGVRLDIRRLGIPLRDTGDSVSEALQERLKLPGERERLQQLQRNMTERRQRLYESDPAAARAAYQASAESRRRKMETDGKFYNDVMARLEKGNPAFRKKIEEDGRFARRMRRAALRGLRNGNKTMQERAYRRREMLKGALLDHYGSLWPSAAAIQHYLTEYHPDVAAVYNGTVSLTTLKKDLRILQEG